MTSLKVRRCACGCGSTNVTACSMLIAWALEAGIKMPNATNGRGYLTLRCARRVQQQLKEKAK